MCRHTQLCCSLFCYMFFSTSGCHHQVKPSKKKNIRQRMYAMPVCDWDLNITSILLQVDRIWWYFYLIAVPILIELRTTSKSRCTDVNTAETVILCMLITYLQPVWTVSDKENRKQLSIFKILRNSGSEVSIKIPSYTASHSVMQYSFPLPQWEPEISGIPDCLFLNLQN